MNLLLIGFLSNKSEVEVGQHSEIGFHINEERKICSRISGYLSDGDVLRPNLGCSTYPPPSLDGYMSEGGASHYAHRLHQMVKEGIRQAHESMNKAHHFPHDAHDDR